MRRPVPGAVLPAAPDANGILAWYFAWDPVDGATNYAVQIGRADSTNLLVDQQVSSPEFRYVRRDGGRITAANADGWYWRVRAQIAGRWSPWVQSRLQIESAPAPQAPTPTPQQPTQTRPTARFVEFRNTGAFVACVEVSYAQNGQRRSCRSEALTAGSSTAVELPAGVSLGSAYAEVFIKDVGDVVSGVFGGEEEWTSIGGRNAARTPGRLCVEATGATFNAAVRTCQ